MPRKFTKKLSRKCGKKQIKITRKGGAKLNRNLTKKSGIKHSKKNKVETLKGGLLRRKKYEFRRPKLEIKKSNIGFPEPNNNTLRKLNGIQGTFLPPLSQYKEPTVSVENATRKYLEEEKEKKLMEYQDTCRLEIAYSRFLEEELKKCNNKDFTSPISNNEGYMTSNTNA